MRYTTYCTNTTRPPRLSGGAMNDSIDDYFEQMFDRLVVKNDD